MKCEIQLHFAIRNRKTKLQKRLYSFFVFFAFFLFFFNFFFDRPLAIYLQLWGVNYIMRKLLHHRLQAGKKNKNAFWDQKPITPQTTKQNAFRGVLNCNSHHDPDSLTPINDKGKGRLQSVRRAFSIPCIYYCSVNCMQCFPMFRLYYLYLTMTEHPMHALRYYIALTLRHVTILLNYCWKWH